MTRYSTSACTVVVEAAPHERRTDVRVIGELDIDALPALDDAVARVVALVPEHVVVELADVSFAGSALPNFLARLVDARPGGLPVTVCHPRPIHRWVLTTTGMDDIVTIGLDEATG